VIKFVSGLTQVGGFPSVVRFPPPVPDGQRHRKLLYFKDGLVLPCVLDYDNMLLVVNNSTTAFLFDDTG
jgi:hypothetical protein